MEVTAPTSGSLYLRGYAYDEYDGVSWCVSEGAWEEPLVFRSTGELLGNVQVKTRGVHEVLYFPYVPGKLSQGEREGGSILNTEKQTSYSITRYRGEADENSGESATLREVDRTRMKQYLQLPQETQQRAEQYLQTHLDQKWLDHPEESVQNLAEEIRTLVTETWYYSLQAKRMPEEETDFAIWFLTEGERGYCVHYATSAAVLLRAAGIPARYVTGYLVNGEANTPVTVTAREAHAWVEYWDPNLGWQRLDATPGQIDVPQETGQPETTIAEPEETDLSARPANTEPSAGQSASDQPEKPDTSGGEIPAEKNWNWIWWILTGLAGILVLPGQWRLRIHGQKRNMHRGTPNERARYCCRLIAKRSRLRVASNKTV